MRMSSSLANLPPIRTSPARNNLAPLELVASAASTSDRTPERSASVDGEERTPLTARSSTILLSPLSPSTSATVPAHLSPTTNPLPLTGGNSTYSIGDRVEGKYRGGHWYLARIDKINPEGNGVFSFDLKYDDGDREEKVAETNIRRRTQIRIPPPTIISFEQASGQLFAAAPTNSGGNTATVSAAPQSSTEPAGSLSVR